MRAPTPPSSSRALRVVPSPSVTSTVASNAASTDRSVNVPPSAPTRKRGSEDGEKEADPISSKKKSGSLASRAAAFATTEQICLHELEVLEKQQESLLQCLQQINEEIESIISQKSIIEGEIADLQDEIKIQQRPESAYEGFRYLCSLVANKTTESLENKLQQKQKALKKNRAEHERLQGLLLSFEEQLSLLNKDLRRTQRKLSQPELVSEIKEKIEQLINTIGNLLNRQMSLHWHRENADYLSPAVSEGDQCYQYMFLMPSELITKHGLTREYTKAQHFHHRCDLRSQSVIERIEAKMQKLEKFLPIIANHDLSLDPAVLELISSKATLYESIEDFISSARRFLYR